MPDQTKNSSTLMILGNGPSLKGIDLKKLSQHHTLGMNVAFRYWHKIDWRPTYYACLDDALIDTHKAALRALIEEERIERFFLSGRFLEHYPEFASHPQIDFLDSFVPHWFNVRGKELGLDFTPHVAFETDRPSLLTTGSYSVRYGAHLGYETIALLGIDLTYCDLPEAALNADGRLVMVETPKSNPNYFFDEYQQAGDEFNVANPDSHSVELHLTSFIALRDDFDRQNLPVALYNTSQDSKLYSECILPYRALTQFDSSLQLGQLVIPFTEQETDQILNNFWLWSQTAFSPYFGAPPAEKPGLIFVANNASAAQHEKRIRKAWAQFPKLQRYFKAPEFFDLNLAGDRDLYQRENTGRTTAEGWRAGPNNMFFGALDLVSQRAGYTLYMETDCVPVRPDWLRTLSQTVPTTTRPWVIGSLYLGPDPLGKRDQRHINGNALYATHDPEFLEFITTTWQPKLREFIETTPELPFDCLLEALFVASDSTRPESDPYWPELQSVAHKFQYSVGIANLTSEGPSTNEVIGRRLQYLLGKNPELSLVHSRLLAEGIAALKASGKAPDFRKLVSYLTRAPATNRANSLSAASSKVDWLGKTRRGLKRRLSGQKEPKK